MIIWKGFRVWVEFLLLFENLGAAGLGTLIITASKESISLKQWRLLFPFCSFQLDIEIFIIYVKNFNDVYSFMEWCFFELLINWGKLVLLFAELIMERLEASLQIEQMSVLDNILVPVLRPLKRPMDSNTKCWKLANSLPQVSEDLFDPLLSLLI